MLALAGSFPPVYGCQWVGFLLSMNISGQGSSVNECKSAGFLSMNVNGRVPTINEYKQHVFLLSMNVSEQTSFCQWM